MMEEVFRCVMCNRECGDAEELRNHDCMKRDRLGLLTEDSKDELTEFERGWQAGIQAAAKLADTQRNVRVHCDYLPKMIENLRPLPLKVKPPPMPVTGYESTGDDDEDHPEDWQYEPGLNQ